MRLRDFKVLTFDCYGTLIDWESGIVEALSGLAARARPPLARDAILEAHARHEAAQQRATPAMPYRRLLAVVHKRLAEEWEVAATWDDALAYGGSVGRWPAFPDTVEALAYLRGVYRLAILSNVDNESFAETSARLGIHFDAVYTAEDIGSYKPDRRNFDYMLDKLNGRGVAPAAILHTAQSLFHDHVPALGLGLASCWIDRRHAQGGFGATMDPGVVPEIAFRFTGLGAMAQAHRAEANEA